MPDTLVGTLRRLRGNARAAIITEPLWGVPFTLFSPYASIYMLAMGLSDSKIGLVTSIALAGQIVFAILSGVITDKLGRKRATLIFDILAWSIPCLLWASAQNIGWFIAAGLINSLRRVPDISWNCLLVEDTDQRDLVHIYAWVYIATHLAAFFAPLAGLLITRCSLIPTVRGLYFLGFLMMTTKFIWLNSMVTETRQGQVRMAETRGKPLGELLAGYGGVIRHVLATPHTLYTIALMVIASIVTTVQGAFWSIIVTQRIGIPDGHVALFPFIRSLVMLAFLFLAVPRLRGLNFGRPLLLAFTGFIASLALLIAIPPHGYALLVLSTFLEACSYAVIGTQIDRLGVINVDPAERARIVSVAHVVVIACTTPFGWIAGLLSGMNRALPFVMNIALMALGMLVVHHLRATGADRAEA